MDLGVGSYGLGFVAGILSTLSPCVLPILPVLLGSATAAHPRAPLAIAMGLAISYASVGTLVAGAGLGMGLDMEGVRQAGAAVLGVLGVMLMSSRLQVRFASMTARLGNAGNLAVSRFSFDGLAGQFVLGMTLGLVWSPCVGPTLGAAVSVASQGTQLPQAAMVMAMFGLGAALPVVAAAHVSRSRMLRARGRLMDWAKAGKVVLGLVMLLFSLQILTGLDKVAEAWLLDLSPDWLTGFTTRV